MNWTPRRVSNDEHPTLVPGVPQYMHSPLREWFTRQLMTLDSRGRRVYDIAKMHRRDLAVRGVSYIDDLRAMGPGTLFDALDSETKLDFLDWLIYDNTISGRPRANTDLELILSAGSSKWKVGARDGVAGLEDRVPQGVQDAAESAMAMPGDAGRLLSEAWHAVYGMNRQPDLGYRKSIEAVEAVVNPIVLGNDNTGHLGKAIGQMRSQGNWKMPFIKEHKDNPSEQVALGMLQALWSGHSDRHPGTPNYIASTQEAAEAAVSLAVTLVNLFSNGGIARR